METTDKLMKARCRLMIKMPWYGHFAMRMVWKASDMEWLPEPQRTMGVRVMSSGDIECIYYPPFVDRLSVEENYAVVQHEIEHVVRLHCLRRQQRHPEAWNIAADMCINGTKDRPRIGYEDVSATDPAKRLIVPDKDHIVWIPKDWPSDESAEYYYDKLLGMQPKKGKGQKSSGGSGQDDDQGSGDGEGEGGSESSGLGKYGRTLDDHSIWDQSDMDEDTARQLVKNACDYASGQAQGNVPGHLKSAIDSLNKPIVRWRELLRQYMGRHLGNNRKTYARRNRRQDVFGLPGKSHRAAATATVIVDTSGSISKDDLSQFFAEIESIAYKTKVMILQWDHAFQGYEHYRRGAWKNFKISGRGGTDMAAPVRWLMDNKLINDVQIMLTDGYCNYVDAKSVAFPFVTVITQKAGSSSKPDYGHTIYLQ